MFWVFMFLPSVFSMAQMCLSELDCDPGLKCEMISNSYKFCVKEMLENQKNDIMQCSSNSDCVKEKSCHQDENGSRCVVYCLHDMDCSSGESCVLQRDRSSICEIGRSKYSRDTTKGGFNSACKRDSDCISELNCVDYYGELLCRDNNQGCPERVKKRNHRIFPEFGIPDKPDNNPMHHLQTSGPATPPICLTDADCPAEDKCVYKPIAGILACHKMPSVENLPSNEDEQGYLTQPNVEQIAPQEPEPSLVDNIAPEASHEENTSPIPPPASEGYLIPNRVNTSINYNIGLLEDKPNKTLIPTYDVAKPTKVKKSAVNSVIDPAATPCQYDYQCRMGESCSGIIQMVDYNITVCEYDVERKNRLCIMHSDCLQGQRCQRNLTGDFVCETSLAASVGNISCLYDYECSGGEKCLKIEENKEKMGFRCRQSQFPDPRRNQKCRSNADCPYQQVCRRLIDAPMCIDIGTVVTSQQPQEIQSKLLKFVHDLLFTRA